MIVRRYEINRADGEADVRSHPNARAFLIRAVVHSVVSSSGLKLRQDARVIEDIVVSRNFEEERRFKKKKEKIKPSLEKPRVELDSDRNG